MSTDVQFWVGVAAGLFAWPLAWLASIVREDLAFAFARPPNGRPGTGEPPSRQPREAETAASKR